MVACNAMHPGSVQVTRVLTGNYEVQSSNFESSIASEAWIMTSAVIFYPGSACTQFPLLPRNCVQKVLVCNDLRLHKSFVTAKDNSNWTFDPSQFEVPV
jgi:hypothetical protein